MWNCCCEYQEQGNEECECPDWCDEANRRVKGRFGLAFVAETPCCCPEPIGWQVEFCDTPSKVEQRCKEMVQWANCPPLPRCEPCPPIEVMSPCFPPRCNPCCPLTNPCPPRCPPRCCPCPCPCPRPPSPRRKCCPKVECICCPPPKCKQKCCCSKSKPKCRCNTKNDEVEEDYDDDDYCPCKKDDDRESSNKSRRDNRRSREDRRNRDDGRSSDRERDSDIGDRAKEKESERNVNAKSSFYEDEVPVKESKPKAKETESQVYKVNTPAPYRTSNQRASTTPRASTGRNSSAQSKMNTQTLSTPSQANSARRDSSRNVESSNVSIRKTSNTPSPAGASDEELFIDFTKCDEPGCENNRNLEPEVQKDDIPNTEDVVSYIHYQPSINFQPQRDYTYSNDVNSNGIVNLYKRETKDDNSIDNLELTKSFNNSTSTRKTSRTVDSKAPIAKMSQLNPQVHYSTIISSIKQSKQSHPLGTFTTVCSNKQSSEFEEFLIKRRKWLPYEFIKNVRRKVVSLFKNNTTGDNENELDSGISYVVYDDVCNNLMSENKDIKKN